MFFKCSPYLTLVIYVVVALAVVPFADAHLHHRDHVNLKRVLRKRSPQFVPVLGGGTSSSPTPTPATSSAKTSSTPSVPSSASSSPSNTGTSQNPTATSSSNSGGPSVSGSVKATNSEATSQESASPSLDSQDINFSSAPQTSNKVNKSQQVTFTASSDPSPTSTNESSTQSSSTKKGATVMVLIIVASSIAAIAVIWTIFRKWKLGRSSKFDERLNPIDWQPTAVDDGQITGAHRRLSGTSFHSNPSHGSPANLYGTDASTVLPEHDFTAGPAALAPVGGYADLARGTGPPPLMHQASYRTVTAPTKYDVGVPLHHQAAYVAQEPYDPSGRY